MQYEPLMYYYNQYMCWMENRPKYIVTAQLTTKKQTDCRYSIVAAGHVHHDNASRHCHVSKAWFSLGAAKTKLHNRNHYSSLQIIQSDSTMQDFYCF